MAYFWGFLNCFEFPLRKSAKKRKKTRFFSDFYDFVFFKNKKNRRFPLLVLPCIFKKTRFSLFCIFHFFGMQGNPVAKNSTFYKIKKIMQGKTSPFFKKNSENFSLWLMHRKKKDNGIPKHFFWKNGRGAYGSSLFFSFLRIFSKCI